MKIFEHFNNTNGTICPICGKGTDKKAVLIPLIATREGNICEATQVHLECLDPICEEYNNNMIIYHKFIPYKRITNENK